MTDEKKLRPGEAIEVPPGSLTPPSKVHKAATYAASALVAGAKGVSALAGKLPVVSQVKTAIAGSARTWEIAVFWLLCVIAAYVWGHQEEAKKYTQVFARLSACVSNQAKPVSVPVCAPAPAAEIAPQPLLAAPPAAAPEVKAPAPRRAKKAAAGAWWQF